MRFSVYNKNYCIYFNLGQDHNKVSTAVVSPPVTNNQFQKLVQEKEALVQQSVLQQYETKRLTKELKEIRKQFCLNRKE